MGHAFDYFGAMINSSLFSIPNYFMPKQILLIILVFFIFEWFQKNKEHTFDIVHLHQTLRWGAYFSIFFLILSFGKYN